MSITEILLIAVGLSMDAFAVSMCRGLKMKKINYKHALIIAALFGGFQAGMPLLGWLLGKQFEKYITKIDHWIAFCLLLFIGGKMLFDALKKEKKESEEVIYIEELNLKELLLMAVATSIDALAVGITFAFLQVNIWISIGFIGIITFALSFGGVLLGHKFGAKYEKKATLLGGIVLILIGLKILLEHLGIINF